MHLARFYSKKHQQAYVVLGHCKDFEDTHYALELFQVHTNIKIPKEISLAEVEKGPYKDMVVLKFKMHPVEAFDQKGGEWIILDDNPEAIQLLKPKT